MHLYMALSLAFRCMAKHIGRHTPTFAVSVGNNDSLCIYTVSLPGASLVDETHEETPSNKTPVWLQAL